MIIRHIVVLILPIMLGGCIGGVSTPTQFYSLGNQYTLTNNISSSAGNNISIGIGPITLPDSLNRPQIVTRENDHRVIIAEFHHWAGDLKDNMMNLLAVGVAQQIESSQVSQYPWPRYVKPEFQIHIDVWRFEGALGKQAELNGTWSLIKRDATTAIQFNTFAFRESPQDNSYLALVDSMSKVLLQLAKQIADVIVNLQQES